jgi:PASTA domain
MLAVLRRLGIVVAIAIAFLFGLATTVYLSLRSPEVKVPEVIGKDRFVAENELKTAGLNFRVRAIRPSNQVKADTVLFQLPRSGEVVKEGQTVAVDVSRTAKEGEASETVADTDKSSASNANGNSNANAAASSNQNENKPKKNKNTNGNSNANGNANGNRNSNTSRANANAAIKSNANNGNVNAVGTRPVNANRIAPPENGNSNRANRNTNRPAPVVAPTPPRLR